MLTPTPTPLDMAPRFSAEIGREVWIKRDDIGSIGLAGNKVRKLEYIAAQADDEGIDAFIVVGALQSNAARAVAALAAATGRRCVIAVPGEKQPVQSPEGNLLLSLLFGAEIRFVGATEWAEAEHAAGEIAAEIESTGQHAMLLPTGASSPLGAASFVAAHQELLMQLDRLDTAPALIVHASSSGGTAAGLHLGQLNRGGPRILSVDVGRLFPDVRSRIAELATLAAEVLGAPRAVACDDISITFDFVGDGYAIPTVECLAAIRLLARTEGIVCDPVYSGKALAAICSGHLPGSSGPVVFWHTGGAQSVLTAAAGQLLVSGAPVAQVL
jgi:1-aminocyclopropane-1-carboxylate deaminase/D-cysteine desulfhydrase-like pyridoxal-dependent ACC family enzyme